MRFAERDATRRPDSGATLIETLVAILLLGTVGVAVLAALAAAATAASTQRDVALAQSWLASTGDVISDPRTDYRDCESDDDATIIAAYQHDLDATRPADAPSVTVVDIDYWDGTRFADVCRLDAGHRLQRVELATDVGGVAMSLAVVKRPLAAATAGLGPLPPGTGTTGGFAVTPGLDGG